MEKNSIRITLRIPEQLHEKLTDSANAGTRSLNSEILKRLEDSYCQEQPEDEYMTMKEARAFMEGEFKKLYTDLLKAGLKPIKDITPDEALGVARDSMQQVADKRK